MKKDKDGNIVMTEEEAQSIRDFIWDSLYKEWDRYTENYIIADQYTLEEGMRRMNDSIYDLQEQIQSTIYQEVEE